jgi:DNA-binding transcriptional LysR family regulator
MRWALACHITQPALSNALRALEEEFATTIVKRGRSFAGFTPEGERILASAQRMLHEHELLQQELNSAAGRPQGTLTLGAVPTAMPIAARFVAVLQARHPGITPVLRSMSSPEIEVGLESLAVDIGLGYTDRVGQRGIKLKAIAQYTERYFLLRRAARPAADGLQIGTPMAWVEAAELPLSMLTAEMHNRTIIDSAFAMAGAEVKPAIQTNSILTLGLSVVAGAVCSVLPGALVDVMRGYRELEALPLVQPEVLTPIGFMVALTDRPSRTLEAAIELAHDADWQQQASAHSGALAL